MQDAIIIYWVIAVTAASLVMGVFFLLRCIDRYRLWQDGEKDEFWIFLAFLLGGFAALFIGIGVPGVMVSGQGGLLVTGIIVGLGAMGIATVYYIFVWRSMT